MVEDEPAQYADVAEILNDLLESEETKAGRDYWQKYTSGQLLNVHLPFAQESNVSDGFNPQVISIAIEPEVMPELDDITRTLQTSTAVFTLTCWETLLWRFSGQPELTVGAAFDGRSYEGLSRALGPFAKYLPVRCQLADDSKFSELLKQTEDTTGMLVKWQDYFSWHDVTASDDSRPSTFSACFEFIDQTDRFADWNVIFSVEKQYVCAERFNLKLCGVRKPEGLHFELHYDENLFAADTIKRLASQFQTLLGSAVAAPDSIVSKLQIVREDELRQLLVEFNRSNVNHGANNQLHVLFEDQARRTPENVAVVSADRSLTYAELNARANRFARRLVEMGVGAGSVGRHLCRALA